MLKASIDSVRWLSLQACALRGDDESSTSRNRGNLIKMVKLMGRMNVDVSNVVLEKAPKMLCTVLQKCKKTFYISLLLK